MVTRDYDTIIIGAGTMGIATSYYLAKSGSKVLVLEQFDLFHNSGSSHGESRIIRKTYNESYFVEMMKETYKLWDDWSNELNEPMILKTGGLNFGSPENKFFNDTLNACKISEINFEHLTNDQIKTRFPMLNLPENYEGIYQEDAGILNPSKILPLVVEKAKSLGTEFITNSKVIQINQNQDNIQVKTSENEFTAKKIVITVGGWLRDLLIKNGIQLKQSINVWNMSYAYFKASEEFSSEKFPVFIGIEDDGILYGFPIAEKEGYIKVAPHYTYSHITSASNRDLRVDVSVLSEVSNFLKNRFKGVSDIAEFPDTCLYTMSHNENFLIDFIPNDNRIIIGGLFSGHGFKFTPLMGKILSDLVIHEKSDIDLEHFKIENFVE
jgi:monomeric sarcosine oxidase